jgi:hypothetical protein
MLKLQLNFSSSALCGAGGLLIVAITPALSADLTATDEGRSAADYSNGIPAWGGWIVYPSLIVGGVYDDNVYRSSTNKKAAWGTRIIPSFTAELNNGIHQTTIYGMMDARIYADQSDGNAIDANVGIRHRYEVMRDLIVRLSGNYTRQADVFNGGFVDQNSQPLVVNNQVNVFSGEASVEKQFGQAFALLGTTASYTTYDNASQQARNGTIYGATARLGMWVTPQINAFVQGGYDWRRYDASIFDSQGYRVVAGLATSQIGLLQGEIYGGYQSQDYENGTIGSNSSSVYGGRLSYFPTEYWTIRAVVDQSLGVSTVASSQSLVGTAMTVTTASLETTWGLWRDWTVSGRVAYNHAEYVDSLREDNAWIAGVRIGYQLWANLGITFDYTYTNLDSNAALASYERNMFTLGAMYRY